MKIFFLLIITTILYAETLVIVDKSGFQRAKAEISKSAGLEIKLDKPDNNIILKNKTEELQPTKIQNNIVVFNDLAPGVWNINSSSKIISVAIK